MSKEKILSAIRQHKPAVHPLPTVPLFEREDLAVLDEFLQAVTASGGTSKVCSARSEIISQLKTLFPTADQWAIAAKDLPAGDVDLSTITDPLQLKTIDLAVLDARLGVAENGALWIDESLMSHRVLPFITQHLVLVVAAADIVWNMHQAYQRIQIDQTGFGVFIAGPSKTADIEQSLVIGAQAARSLTVFVVDF